MDKLTNEMIKDLAIRLGLEPALLKAVQLVEAAGRDGFLADGRPQILFEGHIMYKEFHKKFLIEIWLTFVRDILRFSSLNGINRSTWEVYTSTKDSN